jgi:iron complex transport system ATP-binding protein
VNTLLELSQVTFRYGSREILSDLNLRIGVGDSLAIIGPNGAGKTTLLRIMSGVLRPDEGQVRFAGYRLEGVDRRAARSIAFVPQMMQVPFDFTVEQIVRQGRTPHLGFAQGWKSVDADAVESALELTDTATLRDRVFHHLSGGEQQRVKIAIAVAQESQLMLLDEPTQQLDIGRQHEVMDLIHQLKRKGITIVAAIHDLGLVEANFDSALLLSPGADARHGTPEDILRPNLLEAAFNCPPRHQPKLVFSAERRKAR